MDFVANLYKKKIMKVFKKSELIKNKQLLFLLKIVNHAMFIRI